MTDYWHSQRRKHEPTIPRKFTFAWNRARKRAFPHRWDHAAPVKPTPEPTAHDRLVARIRAHKDEVKALRDPGRK
jgi:hypothetical protein